MEKGKYPVQKIVPNSFEPENHWYPRALNATIHSMVSFFFSLNTQRIINRYCHLNPRVKHEFLDEILHYKPKFFLWAGADLINVTSSTGARRQMVLIETNSCPSGQKSMPFIDDTQELGGYKILMEQTFKPLVIAASRRLPKGALGVIYDKNPMEASGYASAMADVFNEPVYFIHSHENDKPHIIRTMDGVVEFRNESGEWIPLRAVFRYLTQRPWNRLPIHTKTLIFNPIIACLAGGRNKMIAAKAYDFFNAEIAQNDIKIFTPETIWDVRKNEIPLWVRKLGGQAVIKIPYTNAGQGVYTIVNEKELERFMNHEYHYEKFIVQSLIGNYNWSSTTSSGKYYHVGTVPDKNGNSFVADLRVMVCATANGFRPLSIYARKAALPLTDTLIEGQDSWEMLGTNLSVKMEDGNWDSDTNRLMLMDRRDFNRLGIGIDDLIQGYIQTILSAIAIDKMAINLLNKQGKFKIKLFTSLNNDAALIKEVLLS
jgi:hypothetical protein